MAVNDVVLRMFPPAHYGITAFSLEPALSGRALGRGSLVKCRRREGLIAPHPVRCARRPRSGTATAELLLNLPIWLIVLFVTAQFGRSLSDNQQISLASRVGAREAAHTANLPETGQVPDNVVQAIGRQLYNAGITCSKVMLEHNLRGVDATLVSGGDASGRPSTPLPEMGKYVRVTVFSQGKAESTTFRYQECAEAG